jgi:hypothetical protein
VVGKNSLLVGVVVCLLLAVMLVGCQPKVCRNECIGTNKVCTEHQQVCAEKNFWGNCVKYNDKCINYEDQCVGYKEVCR